MADYRDLVMEELAADEIDALDDAATWREIARAAIHQLREHDVEIERLRQRYHALLDECRRLRTARRAA